MSRWLVRWRLALRIARRDALRHRGRTLLVLAMVGLPVLAVVAADTVFRTADVTPVEQTEATLGAADAWITGESRDRVHVDPVSGALWRTGAPAADPPWTAAEVTAALPAGSRVVETLDGRLSYRTDLGRADVAATARDAGDPMLDGAFAVVEGRFPTEDGEVAVNRVVAQRGHDIGDTLKLTPDDVPARVVGIVESPPWTGEAFLVLPRSAADLLYNARPRYFVTVPGGLDWPAVQALNERGLTVVSRSVATDPPPPAEWLPPGESDPFATGDSTGPAVLALVVASVVIEVILLAGPAFAVGVRRQRRDLALIAAAGGAPGDLKRVVLASGVVLGGGAAVVGASLGVGLAAAGLPIAERWAGRSFGPFEVPAVDVAVTVAVGLVAGLGAAWFPARQAARTHVVDALTGRRPAVRTSWRSPVLGLLIAAAGLVLVVLGARGTELGVAAGAVLLIVGMVVAAPWLVGLLAPLAGRLPVAGRLAVRDATRNRGRTAPALAAVMATVAGVTALSIGSASDSAQARRDYLPTAPVGSATIHGPELDDAAWARIETVLREQAPERSVHRVAAVSWAADVMRDNVVVRPGCSGGIDDCRWLVDQSVRVSGGYGELVVLGPEAARALAAGKLGEQAARVLDSGRVAVFGGDDVVAADGTLAVAGVEYDQTVQQTTGTVVTATVRLPAEAVAVPSGSLLHLPGVTLVPPQLAGRLPAEVGTVSLVTGGPDDPVTAVQEQQLREVLGELSGVSVTVERGWQDDLAIARYVLFGLGAVLVLVATLMATGLALTDARPDFATLAAVGAAPRTRRLMAMGSAAVVGGGGALLGLLAGLAPGIAVAYPLTAGDTWGTGTVEPLVDIPWLLLGGVAVLVPLLAVAITGLFVRARLPLAQRLA